MNTTSEAAPRLTEKGANLVKTLWSPWLQRCALNHCGCNDTTPLHPSKASLLLHLILSALTLSLSHRQAETHTKTHTHTHTYTDTQTDRMCVGQCGSGGCRLEQRSAAPCYYPPSPALFKGSAVALWVMAQWKACWELTSRWGVRRAGGRTHTEGRSAGTRTHLHTGGHTNAVSQSWGKK